jgi:hypothetical protein
MMAQNPRYLFAWVIPSRRRAWTRHILQNENDACAVCKWAYKRFLEFGFDFHNSRSRWIDDPRRDRKAIEGSELRVGRVCNPCLRFQNHGLKTRATGFSKSSIGFVPGISGLAELGARRRYVLMLFGRAWNQSGAACRLRARRTDVQVLLARAGCPPSRKRRRIRAGPRPRGGRESANCFGRERSPFPLPSPHRAGAGNQIAQALPAGGIIPSAGSPLQKNLDGCHEMRSS